MLPEKASINGKEYAINYVYVNSRIAKAIVKDGNNILIKMPKSYFWPQKIKTAKILIEKVARRLEIDPYWGIFTYPKFYDGQKISILGREYLLKIGKGVKRSSCKIYENSILIRLKESDEIEKKKVRLIRRCLSRHMLKELEERVKKINNEHFGFEIKEVRISYAIGRWGSCNALKKSIRINMLTLMAPLEVIDYVIVHELAHLKEPNHSDKFWSIVKEACPDYKERSRWLKENGRKLNAIGYF